MRKPKKQKKPLNDLSRSLTPLDVNHTLIAVKSSSIKGQGCRSGGGAAKAIELTWGGLRHVPLLELGKS